MMNDEEKKGSAEARKRGRAEVRKKGRKDRMLNAEC